MSENLEKIYRRLQKLMAIANDTRANPAEAAAAASQAENIMRKYQIEESDIVINELKSGEAQNFDFFDVGADFDQGKMKVRQVQKPLSLLAVAVARLNDCQAKIITDKIFGKMLRFQGYKPDVMVCKFTFRYILNAMRVAAKYESAPDDFRLGYSHAVVESLGKALADKQADRVHDSRALVVIKKDAVALHFGEVNYVKSSLNIGNRNAFEKGVREGRKLDVLLRGVGHTNTPSAPRIK